MREALEPGSPSQYWSQASSPHCEQALQPRLALTCWLVRCSDGCHCGAGAQGILQLETLLLVRAISAARVYDISRDRAWEFTSQHSSRLGVEIEPVDKLGTALRDADIVVTATWANEAFLPI